MICHDETHIGLYALGMFFGQHISVCIECLNEGKAYPAPDRFPQYAPDDDFLDLDFHWSCLERAKEAL